MLHKLRNERGLSVKAFEKGGGVGGTWYFNRYPGAKSDTEGFVYRYSFDKELLQEWDWNTRYLDQPDVLAYLEPRRRPVRPRPRHPAEHGGDQRRLQRRHRPLDGHHQRRQEPDHPIPRQRARPAREEQHPRHPGPGHLRRPARAHQRLAGEPGHHRQAGRCNRHRLDRHPVHRRRRQDRRPPHRLPALTAVLRAVRERAGGPGRGRRRPRKTSTRSGTRSATPSSPSGSRRAASRR